MDNIVLYFGVGLVICLIVGMSGLLRDIGDGDAFDKLMLLLVFLVWPVPVFVGVAMLAGYIPSLVLKFGAYVRVRVFGFPQVPPISSLDRPVVRRWLDI